MSRSKKKKKKFNTYVIILILALIIALYKDAIKDTYSTSSTETILASYNIDNIPDYDGNSYVYINGNVPFFKE